MMENKAVVQTNQLCKTFGGKEVLHRCSITVTPGSIYGLLGKNGAGKTTIFKILLGLLQPSMGEAQILGRACTRQENTILRNVGSIVETPVFYDHLSATENMQIHLDYMGLTDSDIEPTLRAVGLPNTGSQPVAEFSLGMRQRLAIARAIIHRPQVLILDEPLNGLDPLGMKEMRELFLRLVKESKMTILLSSHILAEIEHVADTVGIIADGSIVSEKSMAEIRKHPGGLEGYFVAAVSGGKCDE